MKREDAVLYKDELLKDFDFEKVHAHMVATNWTWLCEGPYNFRVPSIGDIKKTVDELFAWTLKNNNPQTNPNIHNATGGLHLMSNDTHIMLVFTEKRASAMFQAAEIKPEAIIEKREVLLR